MAKVKVFMPTYRRNHLLKRSIASLLNQTFTDWVCEVHNDDPQDRFPTEYVYTLNDKRFIVINHEVNQGPVAVFNMMAEPTDCEYICLLEDDNWWEGNFLQEMTYQMDAHPGCMVGFANLWLWQEHENDQWEKLPNPLWNEAKAETIQLITFPKLRHIFNYHHSNCTIILRNAFDIESLRVPAMTRLDFIEPVRERAYPHPLLFVSQPLANFSLTRSTNRTITINGLYEHTILLMDSFFQNIPMSDVYAEWLWNDARQQRLRAYLRLLYAGISCVSCRKLLRYASLKEWGTFIAYNIKYPGLLIDCLKAKVRFKELWNYLETHTKMRVNESSNY